MKKGARKREKEDFLLEEKARSGDCSGQAKKRGLLFPHPEQKKVNFKPRKGVNKIKTFSLMLSKHAEERWGSSLAKRENKSLTCSLVRRSGGKK